MHKLAQKPASGLLVTASAFGDIWCDYRPPSMKPVNQQWAPFSFLPWSLLEPLFCTVTFWPAVSCRLMVPVPCSMLSSLSSLETLKTLWPSTRKQNEPDLLLPYLVAVNLKHRRKVLICANHNSSIAFVILQVKLEGYELFFQSIAFWNRQRVELKTKRVFILWGADSIMYFQVSGQPNNCGTLFNGPVKWV